jgi:large-conductance mechanosensitive channel
MMIIELLLHGQGNQFKILELSLHAEGNRAMKYSSFLQNLASFKLIIWKTLFCKSLLS